MTDGTGILPLLKLFEETFNEIKSARQIVHGSLDLMDTITLKRLTIERTWREFGQLTSVFDPQSATIRGLNAHKQSCENVCKEIKDYVASIMTTTHGLRTNKAWFSRRRLPELERKFIERCHGLMEYLPAMQ